VRPCAGSRDAVPPRVCFYGDDMTGSTDALANYARCGLSARLVLGPEQVAPAVAEADVVGVAGTARALATDEMEAEVRPVFEAFRRLRPDAVQYKICSTFDSSPAIGSIGRACEIAADVWGPAAIPVVAAQPSLGRWTIFGTHFASAPDGRVYRLDRHPTMSTHPVTPAGEADLATVLRAQTSRLPVTALHWPDLGRYAGLSARHAGPIVLDARTDADLRRIGRMLWAAPRDRAPLVTVGSGGLSYALGSALGAAPPPAARPEPVDRMLAVSGSCSAMTASQIDAAVSAGWIAIDALRTGAAAASREAIGALDGGRSAVVYTARGRPSDGRGGPAIGRLLAEVVTAVAGRGMLSRLAIAGGDTSGQVLSGIGASGLEFLAPIGPGTALCTLRAPGRALDGLAVVLKGGQVGGTGFFELARRGS
jgi:uncharacterized protein YgbK (DUF1537 family)